MPSKFGDLAITFYPSNKAETRLLLKIVQAIRNGDEIKIIKKHRPTVKCLNGCGSRTQSESGVCLNCQNAIAYEQKHPDQEKPSENIEFNLPVEVGTASDGNSWDPEFN